MSISVANTMGILALVFWSMNVAVTRHLSEAHPFAMPGLSFLLSGILVLCTDRIRKVPPPWKCSAPGRFWILGGGAFVVYLLLYTLGLASATTRVMVLPLGLVNYFWPSLILALMPFFGSCSVRWPVLAVGMLLCITGVGASLLWGLSLNELYAVLRTNYIALLMMLAAAFLWAFYSNAVRSWGGNANGVGWFQVAGGVCFLLMWCVTGGSLGFDRTMIVPFVLHAAIVNALAYMLWEFAVRRGDIGLMGTLANFLPLGSIVFGIWYLGDNGSMGLWIGALLVTAGAVLCRKGIRSEG